MAAITKTTEEIIIRKEVPRYVLSLTQQEAVVLQFVTARIKGDRALTIRSITDAIYNALCDAGTPWLTDYAEEYDCNRLDLSQFKLSDLQDLSGE